MWPAWWHVARPEPSTPRSATLSPLSATTATSTRSWRRPPVHATGPRPGGRGTATSTSIPGPGRHRGVRLDLGQATRPSPPTAPPPASPGRSTVLPSSAWAETSPSPDRRSRAAGPWGSPTSRRLPRRTTSTRSSPSTEGGLAGSSTREKRRWVAGGRERPPHRRPAPTGRLRRHLRGPSSLPAGRTAASTPTLSHDRRHRLGRIRASTASPPSIKPVRTLRAPPTAKVVTAQRVARPRGLAVSSTALWYTTRATGR